MTYRVSIDDSELTDLFNQILRIARDQFWVIGIALPVGIYGTVRDSFHNVPGDLPAAWLPESGTEPAGAVLPQRVIGTSTLFDRPYGSAKVGRERRRSRC